MESNPQRYLESIAKAAVSQSRQVRDLIGSRHWLSDGRHKEALLAGLIRQYAPAGTLVCSGFVLHPSDASRCSREQDVLVLDTLQEAPLFHHDGLAVALPNTVLAAISVKTQFRKKELLDACATLNTLLDVATSALARRPIWCGAYFFEDPNPTDTIDTMTETIKEALEELKPPIGTIPAHDQPQLGVAALATAAKMFAKVAYSLEPARASLATYDTALSSALFLAHLIDHIATSRGAPEASLVGFADASLTPATSPITTFELPIT